MSLPPLRLYTRAGCCLCERAEQTLDALGWEYEAIDLESDSAGPELLERWRTEIPVLVHAGSGEPLLSGILSRSRLAALKLRLLKEGRKAKAADTRAGNVSEPGSKPLP
ncbi:glutaredoxin family protein [Deinococcus lacus]|uniref:Glutaredoxin family protein n=1 Tax=Deinococcus lacus TaxID=392561 RepID=A0ABW1YA32_9DEIO